MVSKRDWTVDIDLRAVEVHRTGEKARVYEPPHTVSPLLPAGLEIKLGELFRD